MGSAGTDHNNPVTKQEEKVKLTQGGDHGMQNGAVTKEEEEVRLTAEKNDGVPTKRLVVKQSVRARMRDRESRRKLLSTLLFGASFWALGFILSQRGPAFLDLQLITGTDVEAASYFFMASSTGYLIGSMVAGVVYERVNTSLLLLVYLLGMGASTVAVPWCSPYPLMVAMHAVFSLFGGGLETIGNTEMVRMWGKGGEGSMQFIHFSYAFGGVIAPLVTEPFLTPVPDQKENTTTMARTFTFHNTAPAPISVSEVNSLSPPFNSSVLGKISSYVSNLNKSALTIGSSGNSSVMDQADRGLVEKSWLAAETRVHYAYLISGAIIVMIMVPAVVQVFTDRSHRRRRQAAEEEEKDVTQPLPLCWFLFVMGTLCLFNFLNVAVEDTFASYLSSFVVKQLHWTKSSGAQVTSLFWAMFAVCRFLSIFAVRLFSSVGLLLGSCVSLALSMLGFVLCSYHNVDTGVWVSAAMVGASIAAIFPTGFSWMEEELVRVTGRVTSSIVISASAGSMSAPVLLGFLMKRLSPMWFPYLMFGEAAVCAVVFLLLLALSRLHLRKRFTMSPPSRQQEVTVSSCEEDGSNTGEESTV